MGDSTMHTTPRCRVVGRAVCLEFPKHALLQLLAPVCGGVGGGLGWDVNEGRPCSSVRGECRRARLSNHRPRFDQERTHPQAIVTEENPPQTELV
jgi:hypothetical protein